MLRRRLIILALSLLLTIVSYHIPFLINQKIGVEVGLNSELPDRYQELLEKDELNEKEWSYLQEQSTIFEGNLDKKIKIFDIDKGRMYKRMRVGSIYYVVLLWGAFCVLVLRYISEVFISLVFPVIYWLLGFILGLELLMMASIGLLCSFWFYFHKRPVV